MPSDPFDFIIVGAGTAGCLLANRLSSDPSKRVLLIEAGKKDNYPWIHIPVGYLYCIGNPRTDWLYRTEPEPHMDGRRMDCPRGRVLGGSTRATVCFLTNFGRAYTTRIEQLPNTTGYGDPVQKLFDFSDKESIVGVLSMDERVLPKPLVEPDGELEFFQADSGSGESNGDSSPYFLSMTAGGFCARFSVRPFMEPSTRNGHRSLRPTHRTGTRFPSTSTVRAAGTICAGSPSRGARRARSSSTGLKPYRSKNSPAPAAITTCMA